MYQLFFIFNINFIYFKKKKNYSIISTDYTTIRAGCQKSVYRFLYRRERENLIPSDR